MKVQSVDSAYFIGKWLRPLSVGRLISGCIESIELEPAGPPRISGDLAIVDLAREPEGGISGAVENHDPNTGAEPILGEHRMPLARPAAMAYFLIAAGNVLVARSPEHYILSGLFAVIGGLWLALPATVVTSTGVRLATVRPWRRSIAFSEVGAVLTPSALSQGRWLRLLLRDDDIVTLAYLGSEHAAVVARLAGLEVRPERHRPMPRPVPLMIEDPDRPLSEADLAKRFANLQRGAAQLASELRRPDGKD